MRKTSRLIGNAMAVTLATAMATGLVACGGKGETADDADSATTGVVVTEETEDEEALAPDATDATGTAAPTAATAYAYDYTAGTLGTVMNDDGTAPLVPDFAISGMILRGNRQDETAATDLAGAYMTSGLKADYYYNEWIEFYFDEVTQSQLPAAWKIVCAPHHAIDEYKQMTGKQIEALATESYGFVLDMTNQPEHIDEASGKAYYGSGYVSLDAGTPGMWDLLFMKDGKVAQYVVINLSVEPVA